MFANCVWCVTTSVPSFSVSPLSPELTIEIFGECYEMDDRCNGDRYEIDG
jgi:hypothetical protein